jgi:hypothetical protein
MKEYRTHRNDVQMTCGECQGSGDRMTGIDPACTIPCEECNGTGWITAECEECGTELTEEPCGVCGKCSTCCECFFCKVCEEAVEDEGNQVVFEGEKFCPVCFKATFTASYCPDAFGGKGGPCVFRCEDESGCEDRCAGGAR